MPYCACAQSPSHPHGMSALDSDCLFRACHSASASLPLEPSLDSSAHTGAANAIVTEANAANNYTVWSGVCLQSARRQVHAHGLLRALTPVCGKGHCAGSQQAQRDDCPSAELPVIHVRPQSVACMSSVLRSMFTSRLVGAVCRWTLGAKA